MHDHQTGAIMTYLTIKEHKMISSLQYMVSNNRYVNQSTYFPIFWYRHILTSFHPNCHHQLIHCQTILQVEYLPTYQRHAWNYAKANKDAILPALQNVDWHRLFNNKTLSTNGFA